MLGAERAQHDPLELLGICERTIRAIRADKCKLCKRIRTPFPDKPQTLGQHIHRRRLDAGLTQGQLAEQWGIWRATLGAWEADHYVPQGQLRGVVAEFVGLDLLSGTEVKPTSD